MARSSQINGVIGFVVPTLGERPKFLTQCLESIRASGAGTICLVAPIEFDFSALIESGLVDQFCPDPGKGLAAAINAGIASLPAKAQYVNWLGDDDLLRPGAATLLALSLESTPGSVFAYGGCDYIDESGERIWTNSSGAWAAKALAFGPDLVPQPSSLFLRSAFEKVNRLDENYKLAFDFDLFLKLSKIGSAVFVPEVLASFRWHLDSLTVSSRKASVREASQVRQNNRNKAQRTLGVFLEPLVRFATFYAGVMLSRKLLKSKDAK